MSSATSNTPMSDPKHGGALFRVPREIRDEIYRLLVTGRYQADVGGNAGPDLSILRVSKVVGCEAAEILYSDSVFRFTIELHEEYEKRHSYLYRLKRVASTMKNVVIDIDGPSIDRAEYFQWLTNKGYISYIQSGVQHEYPKGLERFFRAIIDLFGDPDIKRHTLGIRLVEYSSNWLETTSLFNTIFQGLKTLNSFHVATVEVMLTRDLLENPDCYAGFKELDPSGSAYDIVRAVLDAVTEQLEPAFGPVISGFKSDAGKVPTSEENLLCLGDTNLVGFLEFHPSKHRVKESAAEEDRLQRGVSHRLARSKILRLSHFSQAGLKTRRRSI